MEILKVISFIFLGVYGIIYLIFLFKTKKPFKNLLFNAIIGIVAMCIIALIKNFTGVFVPFNQWTVISSTVGGLPAVCGLLIARVIFGV